MNKFGKVLIILSIVSLLLSLSAIQFGDVKKPVVISNQVIGQNNIPTLMFDIRGTWKLLLTWSLEPPTWEWTFTFTGTKTSGTFKGIQKTHGHEWLGTYQVSGMQIQFNEDPSTIDQGGTGTSFPTNCTGKFINKDKMQGTFKNGPDGGTWVATRKLILKPVIIKRK